jgi:ADP-ribosyl-[dinitrogen reductase] hydrolase
MLGLACGDALGTTVEFCRRGTFPPVTDMIGGGPFRLKPGQWTDDTSMALCLAESLVECRRFDAVDQMNRYTRWFQHGHLSSTGVCFDIGNTTRTALANFIRTGEAFSGPTGPDTAGNGSIMRLAPVVLACFRDPERTRQFAAESSRTTHGAPEAVHACQILGGILARLLAGESKESALLCSDLPEASPRLRAIAAGSYESMAESDVRGTGYVVACLEAALWCFAKSSSFEEAVLRAVNLGDDADTTGAVCGQIAGAHWGVDEIPRRWRERLAMREEMLAYADKLIAMEL